MTAADQADTTCWYALRDLKRPNALVRAWQQLTQAGLDVFTPLHWVVTTTAGGKTERRQLPVIPDLLFVRATRAQLDPHIAATPTLQYRYRRGAPQCTPITVPAADMARFVMAVRATDTPRYYRPEELTPDMLGRLVTIVGGPLDGLSGHLLRIRGTRTRRLLIELPGLLTAAIEVSPTYLHLP